MLERAVKLNEDYGGGSITALPIIETQAGDVSAYIPTNVISITDGQIFLESALFNSGVRPAVNPGLSVSRVGGSAQVKGMKKISGPIRIELAQFRELAAFAQFGSDLDKATLERLEHGKRIVEVLKQPQYSPLSVEEQIVTLFAVTKGYVKEVPVERIKDFEPGLLNYLRSNIPFILGGLKQVTDNEKAIKTFKNGSKPMLQSPVSADISSADKDSLLKSCKDLIATGDAPKEKVASIVDGVKGNKDVVFLSTLVAYDLIKDVLLTASDKAQQKAALSIIGALQDNAEAIIEDSLHSAIQEFKDKAWA